MRPPFSVVLAATDFSSAGDAAVQTAYALTAPGGTVHLVHFPEPEIRAARSGGSSDAERSAAKRLEGLVPEAAVTQRIRTETHVIDGPDDPVAILERETKRVGAQAVVLGSHGSNPGWKRMLLGSVAEGAVKRVTAPVVLVRPPK
jgi:nucleotide-binding universal stress UspA family protein